jgi:hypothetical protein
MENLEEFLDNSARIFDSLSQEEQVNELLKLSENIDKYREKLKKLYALKYDSKRLPRKTKKRVLKNIFRLSKKALVLKVLEIALAAPKRVKKIPPCVGHANE